MNLVDIPDWIIASFSDSKNMRQVAEQLRMVVADIDPFVEANFCSNHIKAQEVVDTSIHARRLWEGLWHLHVLWCMRAHDLELANPESLNSDDDGIVVYKGEKIGIEVTFTSWGAPSGSLASTYRQMIISAANVNNIDIDITDQLGKALAGKEAKLVKRQPTLTRFVTLNEVLSTGGFPDWGTDTAGRRSIVVQSLRSQNPVGISGITYDYVSYRNFFRDPKLTLVTIGPEVNKYRDLAMLLSRLPGDAL
jgi:hypothetical protein